MVGADGRIRTHDPLVRSQILYPTELHPHTLCYTDFVVRMAGFEPTTLWFVARYSIQLSYIRVKTVESKYYALSLVLANKIHKIPYTRYVVELAQVKRP